MSSNSEEVAISINTKSNTVMLAMDWYSYNMDLAMNINTNFSIDVVNHKAYLSPVAMMGYFVTIEIYPEFTEETINNQVLITRGFPDFYKSHEMVTKLLKTVFNEWEIIIMETVWFLEFPQIYNLHSIINNYEFNSHKSTAMIEEEINAALYGVITEYVMKSYTYAERYALLMMLLQRWYIMKQRELDYTFITEFLVKEHENEYENLKLLHDDG